jgi:hypothetical protein
MMALLTGVGPMRGASSIDHFSGFLDDAASVFGAVFSGSGGEDDGGRTHIGGVSLCSYRER